MNSFKKTYLIPRMMLLLLLGAAILQVADLAKVRFTSSVISRAMTAMTMSHAYVDRSRIEHVYQNGKSHAGQFFVFFCRNEQYLQFKHACNRYMYKHECSGVTGKKFHAAH